jgi:hypothetical protein
MNRRYAWFGRAAVALAVLLGVSACATVVDGALGLAGVGKDDSPEPTAMRRPLAVRPVSPAVQSGYRVWPPVTDRMALNRSQLLHTQWDPCEMRRAADGLVPARRLMVPTERVATMGPLEVRAALVPALMAGGLGTYGLEQPDRRMSVPNVPSMGTLPCGFPIFNIGLTWYGSPESIVTQ